MSDGVSRLYKFYGRDRGLDNLSNRRLKISTLDDLNDPFEFRGFRLPNAKSRQIWESTRNKIFEKKGIICFCKSWSDPVIWSHYGENHRGLALGFDVPNRLALPVSYRKHRRKYPDLKNLPIKSLMGLIQTSLATKYIHWQYEDEVRLFVSAEERCALTGLYFKPFDHDLVLSEVIIGPNSNLTASEIRAVSGDDELPVVTSRFAFQSYKVVRQRKSQFQK